MKILYFDDYHFIYQTINNICKKYSYIVDIAKNKKEANLLFNSGDYDLIIADINADYSQALDFIIKARKNNKKIPIIITSKENNIETRLMLLDYFIDDYIEKPFNWDELMLKARNLYYRSNIYKLQIQNWKIFGKLKLDILNKILIINEQKIKLRQKEFLILQYLLENNDKIISREELLEKLWDQNVNLFSNSINVHIFNLRKIFKKFLNANIIKTYRGQGLQIDIKALEM